MFPQQGLASASPCFILPGHKEPIPSDDAISCMTSCVFSPFISTMHNALFSLLFFVLLTAESVIAQGLGDTRYLQEHDRERAAAVRERERLDTALSDESGQRPMLLIDGQLHSVGRTASALGQALYLSLQQHAWPAAQAFLDEYLTLADRDPLLVHYAQGLLARSRGKFDQAEAHLRALLSLQSDFLPARLALARVYFETAQVIESKAMFLAVLADLDTADTKTEGVRKTINAFLEAIDQRKAWSGAASLGVSGSDNVNRSSASRVCLMPGEQGVCYLERTLPSRIKATGSTFDATVQKRLPLKGHHGISLRMLANGVHYRDASRYNEASVSAQAGYSYHDVRSQFTLAPVFQYREWGQHALYGAWGLQAEWRYRPTAPSLLKLEADYQRQRYRDQSYARHFNGAERSLRMSYFRDVGSGWTLFGGLDAESSGAQTRVHAYRQQGVRLGTSLTSRGYTASVHASYKHRRYDAYNPLLKARRQDYQQSYTATLTATRWETGGFVPSFTVRHHKANSNVAWLHAYQRNEISLRFEYAI